MPLPMPSSRTPLVVAMFMLLLVLAALDQTILATALPAITQELQGGARLSWVFSAYLIGSTVVIPLYGKLADVHGSRPMLLAAVVLFLAGSLACGFSASMDQLIAARALQGLGGGGLLTLTMLGVADLYPPPHPPHQRGKVQGLLGAAYGIATMFGPLTGGYVVEHLSWHWAFFINVPAALLALAVLAWCFRPCTARHPHAVDTLGSVLLGAALVCLLLATRREAGTAAATAAPWLLLAAVVFGAAFVAVERRVVHPLLPLSMFGVPAFSAATGISLISGVGLFAAVVFLPTYLQTALHKSPSASAWHLLPLMAGITVAAMSSGRLLRRHGRVRRLAQVACGLMLLSFSALAWLLRWLPGEAMALSACVLPLGLGLGLLFPLVTMVAQLSAPSQHLGIATATPIMVRALGGAVGVSLLGSLLAHEMSGQLLAAGAAAAGAGAAAGPPQTLVAAAMAAALQPIYVSAALLCGVAAAATAWLPVRLHRAATPETPMPAMASVDV